MLYDFDGEVSAEAAALEWAWETRTWMNNDAFWKCCCISERS